MAKQANEGAGFASTSEEDIATLLRNKDSINTKRATKAAVRVFEFYIIGKRKVYRLSFTSRRFVEEILRGGKKKRQKFVHQVESYIYQVWIMPNLKSSRPKVDIS